MNPDSLKFQWNMTISGNTRGLPILWLHGFMGSSSDWHVLTESHFNTYCNIQADLPGHGRSILPENLSYVLILDQLKQQLNAAGFKTFVVVGYSMGGRIALHLQQQYPGDILALIGLSTAPGLKTDQERELRRKTDMALMQKLAQLGFDAFLKQWYALPLFRSVSKTPGILSSLIDSRSKNDQEQLRRSLELFGNGALPSLWGELTQMNLPLQLISGSLDSKYCDLNHEMTTQLPHSQHQIIDAGDHTFFLQKPLETAHLIKQFLSATFEGESSDSY